MKIIELAIDELTTVELGPKYCDVIIQRWEQATGNKAVRIDGASE